MISCSITSLRLLFIRLISSYKDEFLTISIKQTHGASQSDRIHRRRNNFLRRRVTNTHHLSLNLFAFMVCMPLNQTAQNCFLKNEMILNKNFDETFNIENEIFLKFLILRNKHIVQNYNVHSWCHLLQSKKGLLLDFRFG